jgi:predicted phage-related endonuclease
VKIIDVVQGSPEWRAIREMYDCASDAPAMMGESKYVTRSELLKRQATGFSEEITPFKQELFDRGHAAEAAIRPHVESIIGEELFPATGVDGGMLASFDGITMAEETIFEHKLWNEDLAASVRAGNLDPTYYWQLEQQLGIARAKRAIFVVSDGTPQKCVHMFYTPVEGRFERLKAGWAQFKLDLAAYTPTEAPAAVMATPVEALPAVSMRVDGSIAVISNLDVFGARLTEFIEKIDKNPSTDQAFADAEAAVKTLEKAQTALEQAEAAALAQTASIDDMRRTVKLYADMARTTRLMLEKVVKTRKDTIRAEIQQKAQKAFSDHVAAINARLGKVTLPNLWPDFAGAMKGKRTITGVQGAVDDELARAKVEANTIAAKIEANLASLRELAAEHAFLFSDAQQIVQKDNADLVLLINSRIAEHKAAEERRLEADRERIRQEERQRAEMEERERLRQEEQQRLEAERAAEEARKAAEPKPAQPLPTVAVPRPIAARIKLGDINARIAPLAISAEGLAKLGFQSVGMAGAAKLYDAGQFPAICRALVQLIEQAANYKEAA